MKLANNSLLACAIEALGEAFSLVEKSGVDASVFHDLVTDGLFACPAYNTYARIIAANGPKMLGLAAEIADGALPAGLPPAAAQLSGVPMPSAQVCRERLLGAIDKGDQQRDWAAMALEQARASGLA